MAAPRDDATGAADDTGPDPAIRLVGVEKRFPGAARPAVTSLDLEIPAGEIVTLVGPSGCGKTTTLKMINRLVEPTGGTIEVLGRDARSMKKPELRRRIGYVIQQIGLFPHKTIGANIGTVPQLLGWDKRRIADRVDELVELVGLDREMLRRYPSELSGGQQQRVGVARALAADPPILLMDEPYSAVDPIVRERLQDELLALQRRVQKTIVLVTHDVDEAIKLGDRMVLLQVGGIIAQQGRPEDVLAAPASAFVEEFLGRERGLKRLSLLTVDDVELTTGWTVEASAPVSEALAVMSAHALEWIGVRDGHRLLGWTWQGDLDGVSTVGEASLRSFFAEVQPSTALREALDGIVRSRTNVAVVCDDDGRYLGMLTLADISEGISPDDPNAADRG